MAELRAERDALQARATRLEAQLTAIGYPSAPTRWRFAAGLIVVVGAALFVALWQLSRPGGSPAR